MDDVAQLVEQERKQKRYDKIVYCNKFAFFKTLKSQSDKTTYSKYSGTKIFAFTILKQSGLIKLLSANDKQKMVLR